MPITANYPTTYLHADYSGDYNSIVTGSGFFTVPGDAPNSGPSQFVGRELFAPWMADTVDEQNCTQVIFIVNHTAHTLTLKGTPYYDGGSLQSQPILPDGLTVNVVPAAYTTDRGTYLGMGRFVQGDGSIFYGSGIGLTLTAASAGFSQDIGIFVAGSVNPGSDSGYGLDVCADMTGVDTKTRFDAIAGLQNTRLGTLREDRSGGVHVQAVILCRFAAADKQFGDAAPLVFVRVTSI